MIYTSFKEKLKMVKFKRMTILKFKVEIMDVKASVYRLFKDRTNVPPSIYDRMKGITLVDNDGNLYKID